MPEFEQKSLYYSYDMRFFEVGDGEALYEEGGVVSVLRRMQPLTEKLGVHLNYSDDTYTGNSHVIKMNGRSYILAEGSALMWGETIARFTEMINAELNLQKSKEQLYILDDESYYLVFLTEEQM